VSGPEQLELAAFDLMKFCTVEGGRICLICLENRVMPLPNIDWTTLLNSDNLFFIPGDEELFHRIPPPPLPPYLGASSSF